jgi:hypothetical protein
MENNCDFLSISNAVVNEQMKTEVNYNGPFLQVPSSGS